VWATTICVQGIPTTICFGGLTQAVTLNTNNGVEYIVFGFTIFQNGSGRVFDVIGTQSPDFLCSPDVFDQFSMTFRYLNDHGYDVPNVNGTVNFTPAP
jgi:hypothetical protein